jgi:hypothetical protein
MTEWNVMFALLDMFRYICFCNKLLLKEGNHKISKDDFRKYVSSNGVHHSTLLQNRC